MFRLGKIEKKILNYLMDMDTDEVISIPNLSRAIGEKYKIVHGTIALSRTDPPVLKEIDPHVSTK